MEYRKEIDGLRALAIIPVMLYHADLAEFSGGFIGVDVFFVISGYLITSLILNELKDGTFSLANFYERRVRRIFPALLFMSIVSYFMALVSLQPSDLQRFSKSLMWLAGFASNILFGKEGDYFDPFTELKPLMHTWSISVEEQFYIIFPLIVVLIWRFRRDWLGKAFIAIALLSLSTSVLESEFYQSKNFYLLQARAWELMIGALVATYISSVSRQKLNPIVCESLNILGLVLILSPIFIFSDERPISATHLLLPTLGTALIILFSSSRDGVGKLLSHPYLVSIGLMSYSLYLWHQPLFAFARHSSSVEPTEMTMIGLIFASFLMAWISWKYVERPIRDQKRFSQGLIFVSLILGSSGLFGLGYFTESYAQEKAETQRGYSWHKFVRQHECLIQNLNETEHAPTCVNKGDSGQPSLLIWGDSNAASLYPGLAVLSRDLKFSLSQLTQSGCPPLSDLKVLKHRRNCNVINDQILGRLAELDFDVIILHAAWLHKDYPLSVRSLSEKLENMIRRIREVSPRSKLVIISSVPRWHVSAVHAFQTSEKARIGGSKVYARATIWPEVDSALSNIASEYAATFIAPTEQLCLNRTNQCLISLENSDVLIYSDYNHLTKQGSEYLMGVLSERIQSVLHANSQISK